MSSSCNCPIVQCLFNLLYYVIGVRNTKKPPVFYIWFGFLCVQVSCGNCETLESWKICNFVPKASKSGKNCYTSYVCYYCRRSKKKIASSRIPHLVIIAILSKLKVTCRMQIILNSHSIPFFKVIIWLSMLKLYGGFVHFSAIKHFFFNFASLRLLQHFFSSLKPEDKH